LAYISAAESIGVSSTTFTLRNPLRKLPNSVKLRCCEGYYAVQGYRVWYQWINTNLAPVLYRFRYITFDSSKTAISGYPSSV